MRDPRVQSACALMLVAASSGCGARTALATDDDTVVTLDATSTLDGSDAARPPDAATSDVARDAPGDVAPDAPTLSDGTIEAPAIDAGVDTSIPDAIDTDVVLYGDAPLPDAPIADGGVVFAIAPHPPLDPFSVSVPSSPPSFQSVTFRGYDQTGDVDALLESVWGEPTWLSVLQEYGFGGGARLRAPAHLPMAAPANYDDDALQADLLALIADGTLANPVDQNLVYVVYVPSTTTFTAATLGVPPFCAGADSSGYAAGLSRVDGSGNVTGIATYVVVPECPPTAAQPVAALDKTTAAASALIADSVAGAAQSSIVWGYLLGDKSFGEVCTEFPSPDYVPAGYTYSLRRLWSNARGAEGHDPCVPEAAGETYFNSALVMPDSVPIAYPGGSSSVPGIYAPLGGSATVEVDLYSDGPIGPWTVTAVDFPQQSPPPTTPNLSFAWDTTSGLNGDKLHLTLTLHAVDPTVNGALFVVHSTLGTQQHDWIGFVAPE